MSILKISKITVESAFAFEITGLRKLLYPCPHFFLDYFVQFPNERAPLSAVFQKEEI